MRMNTSNNEEGYLFLWKDTHEYGFLCQWFYSPFTHGGMTFATAEQFIMYGKARVLNDDGMAYEMLNTPEKHPEDYKKMGIMVKNLDVNIWTSKCVDIVITGNM